MDNEKAAPQHQRFGRWNLLSFTRPTMPMTCKCPPVRAPAGTPGSERSDRPRHPQVAAQLANPPKPKPKSSNPHKAQLRTAGSCMRGFRTPPAPETLHQGGRWAELQHFSKADIAGNTAAGRKRRCPLPPPKAMLRRVRKLRAPTCNDRNWPLAVGTVVP